MVYYPISESDLLNRIENESKSWIEIASSRTEQNVKAGRLVISDSIWSKIKSVYMKRQFGKCIYCEYPLGGRSTQDVEHFRPKSKISAWPRKGGPNYDFSTGAVEGAGYFWLAYEPTNYAASCKDCNSALKRDSFPIIATRGEATQGVAALNEAEGPLLLFPFGNWGDNPTHYFEYDGIFLRPKTSLSEACARRALVTIDFFNLNKRTNLLRGRHLAMGVIWSNVRLRETSSDPQEVKDAEQTILENIIDEAPHALCARSFLTLMKTDPVRASRLRTEARTHLTGLGYLRIAAD